MPDPAYGQTDVMRDPNYLRAMLRSANPHDRLVAQTQLEQLDRDQTQQEHQQMFEESRAQRKDIHDENLAQRKDYQTAMISDREDRQAGLKETAAARQSALNESIATRRAQQLQLIMSDPTLDKNTRAAAKDAMVSELGLKVAPSTTTAPAGKGEYGPGTAAKSQPSNTPEPYRQPTAAFATDISAPTQGQVLRPVEKQNPSFINPNGSRTTQLPSGGIANVFDRSTPQGRAAIGAPHDIPRSTNVIPNTATNNEQQSGIAPSGIMSERRDIPAPETHAPITNQYRYDADYGYVPHAVAVPGAPGHSPASVALHPATNEASIPAPAPSELYTPPTNAFTQPVAATAPTVVPNAAPTPAPGAPQPSLFGINPENVQWNVPAPAASATPPASPPVPLASNDRQDLLREIDNSIYGQAVPAPTPKPTPVPRIAIKQGNQYAFA